jgi:hypothetical protein
MRCAIIIAGGIVALSISSSLVGAQPTVIQTSCHMDYCFWFRLKAKTTLQTRWSGELVKVLSDQGESFHPNGSYEKPQPIKWKTPVESYVFCSKVRPAVIDQDGNRWLATFSCTRRPPCEPGVRARFLYRISFCLPRPRLF